MPITPVIIRCAVLSDVDDQWLSLSQSRFGGSSALRMLGDEKEEEEDGMVFWEFSSSGRDIQSMLK